MQSQNPASCTFCDTWCRNNAWAQHSVQVPGHVFRGLASTCTVQDRNSKPNVDRNKTGTHTQPPPPPQPPLQKALTTPSTTTPGPSTPASHHTTPDPRPTPRTNPNTATATTTTTTNAAWPTSRIAGYTTYAPTWPHAYELVHLLYTPTAYLYEHTHKRALTHSVLHTYMRTCPPLFIHSFIPAFLPSFLPSFLPAFLPSFLPSFHFFCSIHSLHSFLSYVH